MLKGLSPLLTPELLHTLRAMGHGDELALVDANFPSTSMARRLVRLDAADVVSATRAVLSLMPLDDFVDATAWRMQVVDDANAEPPVCAELRGLVEAEGYRLAALERFAFYEQAKQCFAIVATGETRLYGNVILKKGVIRPAS